MSDAKRKRVLVTGAGGRIGRAIRPYLRERYDLRLMCHRTLLQPEEGEEVVAADILDLEAVEEATAGVDAVVHLAARTDWLSSWEEVRHANIDGTYNAFEAARRTGVRKVVFASSNHAAGGYERDGLFSTPDMPVRPDGYYGVTKAFGEALARYYSDEFGLSILCLRIGSFLPKPTNARSLATWLSPRDCAQLIERSIDAKIPFGIIYGISGNARRFWDLSNAEQILGYRPQDNGEDYAAEVLGS